MYIGADEGCHEVPEPIAPIDIMLCSLEPTRIPISSSLMTSNGPMSIFMPPISIPGIFIPGICPTGLAEGLAEGIGMFICSGEAEGDAEGIGMLCVCGVGVGVGDPAGICMPGIFGIVGVGEGEAAGVGAGVAAGSP